ncbi:MAG: hypothetical protein IK084_01175 [Bacteroidaceae bacterium]|nr:hypothetical protein [Bacteroidaceae bacterium]
MEQLTEKQAIAFHDSEVWKDWTSRQIAEFQLEQDRLCIPFDVFHKAMEETLGRPVWTHEFAFSRDELRKEMYGEKPTPSFEEIINLIPANKRTLIWNTSEQSS